MFVWCMSAVLLSRRRCLLLIVQVVPELMPVCTYFLEVSVI